MSTELRRLDLLLTTEEVDALSGEGGDVGLRSLLARGLADVVEDQVVTSPLLGAAAQLLVRPGIDLAMQVWDAEGIGRVRLVAGDGLLVVERPDAVGNLRLTITAAALLRRLVSRIAFDDQQPAPASAAVVVPSTDLSAQVQIDLTGAAGMPMPRAVDRVHRSVSVARMDVEEAGVIAYVVNLLGTAAGWYRLEDGEKGFTTCTPAGASELDELLLVPNVGG